MVRSNIKYSYIFLIMFIYSNLFFLYPFTKAQSFKPTLHVLSLMNILDASVIDNFEQTYKANVRVEFVGSRFEFLPRLKSGIRMYDVVVADTRVMEKLALANLLYSLPDKFGEKSNANLSFTNPLAMNSNTQFYLTLFIDPMIICSYKGISETNEYDNWNHFLSSQESTHGHQKIYIPYGIKQLYLMALLIEKSDLSNTKLEDLLTQLQNQGAFIDTPLELGFLSGKVNTAIVFYSDFLRYKKVLPNLNGFVPHDTNYFDRIAVGLGSNSYQKDLAKELIQFLYDKQNQILLTNGLVSKNAALFQGASTKQWILYNDDLTIPKRIVPLVKKIEKSL